MPPGYNKILLTFTCGNPPKQVISWDIQSVFEVKLYSLVFPDVTKNVLMRKDLNIQKLNYL